MYLEINETYDSKLKRVKVDTYCSSYSFIFGSRLLIFPSSCFTKKDVSVTDHCTP